MTSAIAYLNYRFIFKHSSNSTSSIISGLLSNTISFLIINMTQPNITLYTTQTPNGIKISIALEELGYSSFLGLLEALVLTDCSLPYKVEKIDISKNTQKEEYVLTSLQLSTQTDLTFRTAGS